MRDQTPIEKYAEREGYRIAALVEDKFAIVVKPKPSWMPLWLFRSVIKDTVEIVHLPVTTLK